MNIGDGLTIQLHKIGDKTTSGIFIDSGHGGSISSKERNKNNHKAQRFPATLKDTKDTYSTTLKTSRSNKAHNSRLNSGKNDKTVKAPMTAELQKHRKSDKQSSNNNPEATSHDVTSAKSGRKSASPKPESDLKNTYKKANKPKHTPLSSNASTDNKIRRKQKEAKATKLDTTFVTLTQEQFNTILSMVKTQQDIDVGKALKTDESEKKVSANEDDDNRSDKTAVPGTVTEPTSVPGLDLNGEESGEKSDTKESSDEKKSDKVANSRSNSSRKGRKASATTKDVKNEKGTNPHEDVKNLLKDTPKEELEKNASTSSDRNKENLTKATSFFFGESAVQCVSKKRQEQMRWREELDNQVKERQKKNKEDTRKSLEVVDDNNWTKHFDTMQLSSTNINQQTDQVSKFIPDNKVPEVIADTSSISKPAMTEPTSLSLSTATSTGTLPNSDIFTGNRANTTSPREGNNFLRTMTSLLDPSQIDALDIKRRKQQEQRLAIEAQMEEHRRLKKTAEDLKKQEEEREEKRLEEERQKMMLQFEQEKNKQLTMEERRDRQTQELHRQMQKAQASALKEKFERRQNALKSHGHDTSRLEQTHRFTLESNTVEMIQPPPHRIPPLDITALQSDKLQVQNFTSPEPVIEQNLKQTSSSDLSLLANPTDGAIKLEISLNQSLTKNELVATGVQTDGDNYGRLLDFISDDDERTNRLPVARSDTHLLQNMSTGKKKLKKRDKNNMSQYDMYARRTNLNQDGSAESLPTVKPKWGVGQRKKYLPASQRYVNAKQFKEQHESNVRRHTEHLLAQQAVNEPDRLLALKHTKSSENILDSSPFSTKKTNPSKQHRRSASPPVPAVKRHLQDEQLGRGDFQIRGRPDTAMSVTTDQAKYKSAKHTADSPVPNSVDFVEYIRSDTILDSTLHQEHASSRNDIKHFSSDSQQMHNLSNENVHNARSSDVKSKDPLLNEDLVKQRDRQDRILKEISILRQGLLLKQREVASYPAAIAGSGKSVLSGNLPERSNELVKK